MLTSDSVAGILLALATGYPERAATLIASSEEIDDVERGVLAGSLERDGDRASNARQFGDALRSLEADRNLVNECYRVSFYAGEDWKALSANPFYAFHTANKGGSPLDKWIHYFPIYERHLAVYRDRPVRVLEIGVYRGGGLEMLRQCLGTAARLVGIDIDNAARVAIGSRHTVEIGDQSDPAFLREVSARHGPFDVILDDGGHTMRQQIVSAETLFPLLADGGTYIVEDCHTSYWPAYADQEPDGPTFLEWAKERIDDLHAYHFSREKDLAAPWQTDLVGIHAYDSVVVLDKQRRAAPFCELSGTKEFIGVDRLTGAAELDLIAARDAAIARAAELEEGAGEVRSTAAQLDRFREELHELRQKVDLQAEDLDQAKSDLFAARWTIRTMRRSKSWTLTAPLRLSKRAIAGVWRRVRKP